MNKKGFTLIELLAVIVILGIVLVIATPKIFNALNIGKAKANIINQNNLLTSAKKYYSKNIYELPENIGESKELSINTLISEKYISSITSPYDKSKQCSGYVLVVKLSEDLYDYIPNLDCSGIIKTKAENKLIVHYTFNDFQEPTVNLMQGKNMTVDTSYSTIGGEDAIGKYIIKPINYAQSWEGMRIPAVSVESGKRYTFSIDLMSENAYNLNWDFNVTGTGYVGNDAGRDYSYSSRTRYDKSNSWQNVFITVGVKSDLLNAKAGDSFCPIDSQILGKKIYYRNFQLEQKTYSTPYTSSSRTGTVNDYSGNNKNSSLNLITTPRWINEGYYFNGVNTEIVLPNNIMSTSDIRTNGLTYSIWIKPEQLTNQRIIGQQISSGYSDYSNGGIGINSTGKPYIIAYSDANPSAYVSEVGDTTLTVNKWTHIVGVYDNINNQLRIYVNGKLASSPSSFGTFSRLVSVDSNRIGKMENTTPSYYKGYLDEVRIYNRVLSESEILSIYDYESDFFN